MNKAAVGSTLKRLRGDTPQGEVASAVGVLQSTYSMYESGQRVPSDEVKEKIAAYFNETVQNIFFASQPHKA